MKGILIFIAVCGTVLCAPAVSAVRSADSISLRGAQQSRESVPVARSVAESVRGVSGRTAKTNTSVSSRAGALKLDSGPRSSGAETRQTVQVGRSAMTRTPVATRRSTTTRAATPSNMSETRTGAAYEQCKSAYFQCMDQFCQLKNDDYRRCSCSDRVMDMMALRKNLTETGAKLTEFTENLDMVGLTAEQATAMHTASDGENALTADTSASKALLTAIMNSIRGDDTTVAGKMSDLNSINLSFDTSIAFGNTDPAQVVASYNGVELYNAVYPSCRAAVADDCNDASLQRAVNAYLMAVEQDCNTVQTAIVNKQQDLKAAIREGSAMLDLARVENRKKHNSDDMVACLANVESAVLSEQVCGANYHKCLDNGEFIDITTGAPIAGVVRFYELGDLLKFDSGKDALSQKLSQNPDNQKFLRNFENKTKKFANDALDKCTEIADTVWSEYLDKALLAIYYAQQSKVDTIKNGCFDLISSCYADKETSITAAMAALIEGTSALSLQPDKIILTKQMCSDYIDSCNNMFGENIVSDYMAVQANTDTLAACRAVAQQCFDDFGGTNYENFYYPSSGLFESNRVDEMCNADCSNAPARTALDWFSLYKYDENGNRELDAAGNPVYVSECAKRVAAIDSCKNQVEEAFGGLDSVIAGLAGLSDNGEYRYTNPNDAQDKIFVYGWANELSGDSIDWGQQLGFKSRRLRPTGVATEVYNQIIDSLSNQCMNVNGKFVEAQFINRTKYGANSNDAGHLCRLYPDKPNINTTEIKYGMPRGACSYNANTSCDWTANSNSFCCQGDGNSFGYKGKTYNFYREDVCPKDYELNTDTSAWGICSCWENGGRRSMNGQMGKCSAVINVFEYTNNAGIQSWNMLDTMFAPCQYVDFDDFDNTGIAQGMLPVGYSVELQNGAPTGISNWVSWYSHLQYHILHPDKLLYYWCSAKVNPDTNQVCPLDDQENCDVPDDLPKGI